MSNFSSDRVPTMAEIRNLVVELEEQANAAAAGDDLAELGAVRLNAEVGDLNGGDPRLLR